MPTSLTQDQQFDRFLKLPDPLKDAIASVNTADVIFEIGRTHKFSIEKIGILGQETGLVMSGMSPAREFVSALSTSLKISREEADAIASEINEKLFAPIREHMKGFHGDGWERGFDGVKNQELRIKSSQITPTSVLPSTPSTPTVKPEPLIIRPLGRMSEQRIENREQRVESKQQETINKNPTTPMIQPAKVVTPLAQEKPASEKELPAPIVNPIIRGFAEESREKKIESREQPAQKTEDLALGTREGEQKAVNSEQGRSDRIVSPMNPKPLTPIPPAPMSGANSVERKADSMPMPTSTPVAPAVPSIPVPPPYYEEAKKKMEQEIAMLGDREQRIESGAVTSEQRQTNDQLSVNSQQQSPVEAKKVIEPFRPSPYVISVGDREQKVGNREQTPPSPLPPPLPQAPVISVTPGAGTNEQPQPPKLFDAAQGRPPIPTNPAPNPIRLDKKIPKPPAPESYSVDPYRETTE